MRRPPGALDPRGTARQRVAPAPALPPALAAELRDADLGDEELYLAWQVAEWATALDAGERTALAAIVARTLLARAQGSTRAPVDDAARALLARVPELCGPPGARTPLVLDGAHLYHGKLLACEARLVAAVRARAARPWAPASDVEGALAEVAATAVPPPSDEQIAAVRAALGRSLTVVSGGPGTGKTTIVLALVRALVRLGVQPEALALAAPTGKAANRMEDAIRGGLAALPARAAADEALAAGCPPAQTLHRLLGYSPRAGAFHHHENNRLAQRVVIVDEGSMVDLPLMERLLRALRDDASLVILGDADQLPSVEAGAVFRDLRGLAVQLTRSFRMDPRAGAGRRILEVATRVNAGDAAALGTLIAERAAPADLAFEGVELVPAAAREALLERWYAERLAPGLGGDEPVALEGGAIAGRDVPRVAALHAHLQCARVLCVTRGRPTGVAATNAWLHRRHGGTGAAPIPGEPVMALRNDYDRGLFNGDQGVVVRARPGRLVAAFPTRDGWAAFDLDGLGDGVTLAWAMTVHKAQGSEADDVALLLPEVELPLVTRELVYTALTRSRRSVVICGPAAVLAAAVRTRLERSSGIAERLAVSKPSP